jgi:hypothetical protein
MEDIRYSPDGKPCMVFPAPLAGNTHEEKLGDFARRFMFEDREATPEEVAAFVSGKPTPNNQAPADPPDDWANDAEPTPPVANTVTIIVPDADAQPATDPGMAANKLKSALKVVGVNPATPKAPMELPPGHEFVKLLDDGRIVAMFTDESAPRSPARQVILDPKKLKKLRVQTARARSVGRTLGR